MEEINIWAVEGTQVTKIEPIQQTDSEELLENILVENPNLLMEDLTLVGRQNRNDGGLLDLLGVDRDGKLVVFELKRGTLRRDAVAQVLDYASSLDEMDVADLAKQISERSGEHGIDKIEDFEDWYSQYSEELESLKPLRMFLVGLGVDADTERIVRFLAENSSMDISLLTFHGFDYGSKTILAKQVEVESYEEQGTQPKTKKRKLSDEERWNLLFDHAREQGVSQLFDSVRAVFQQNWLKSIENTGGERLGIRLPERQRPTGNAYARIDFQRDKVVIRFLERSIQLFRDAFVQIINTDKIPYETVPRNQQPLEDTNTKIEFILTSDEWETHKEKLVTLVQSLYEAWQNRDLKN